MVLSECSTTVIMIGFYLLGILISLILLGLKVLVSALALSLLCLHFVKLCEELVSHNLFQLIDSPTRGNNCLDLITSIVESVSNIDITGCDSVALSSDHCALTFTIHFSSRIPAANNNKGLRFNFKRADFDGLRFLYATILFSLPFLLLELKMDGLSGNHRFYLMSRNLLLKENRASLLHHLGLTANFFMPLEKRTL